MKYHYLYLITNENHPKRGSIVLAVASSFFGSDGWQCTDGRNGYFLYPSEVFEIGRL